MRSNLADPKANEEDGGVVWGARPEGRCSQWREAHTEAGFLTETGACEGPTLG